MKTRRHVPIAPGKLGAWVCLVAVILLWTPLWAAAWQIKGMGCCDGKMCAAPGHAGHRSGDEAVNQGSAPMDCGHEEHTGMGACEMKCCHDEGATLVTAVIFVMPVQVRVFAPVILRDVREEAQVAMTTIVVEPPSPPPKSIDSIV